MRFGPGVVRIAPLLVFAGCYPLPLTMGYVDLDPASAGHLDVQGQLVGGAEVTSPLGGAGIAGHVEPFVGRRVSLPVGAGLGVAGGEFSASGGFPLRVGFRHRAVPGTFAWGFGIGPSVVFDRSNASVSGVVDLELLPGFTRRRFGFSFGIRPAFSFDSSNFSFYGLLEPQFAVKVSRASVTFGVMGGPVVTPFGTGTFVAGLIGASVGVHRRF